jgi:hypothetical protein
MIRNLGENINDRFELDTQGKFLSVPTRVFYEPNAQAERRVSS